MKLVIQIPCFNEEQTLPETLAALPTEIPGVDQIEVLVIDDGSIDRTAAVAHEHGVARVVRMAGNQGLARAFMAGLVAALDMGADLIVNTDADNQYEARDIERLVAPILAGDADMVIGARPIGSIAHFSWIKKQLQKLGTGVVRSLSHTGVEDAPSGFRAMNRESALRLNVFSSYSYTLETIIQAGHSNLRVLSVPIRVNGPTRPSRLMRSMPEYLRRSSVSMVFTYAIYSPTRLFGFLALLFLIPGAGLAIRYLVFAAQGEGAGHVQSVIASGVLALCGVFMLAIAVLAHLMAINRKLLEEIRYLERSGHHARPHSHSSEATAETEVSAALSSR